MNVRRIIIGISVSIFIFSMFHILDYFYGSYENQRMYAAVQETFTDSLPKAEMVNRHLETQEQPLIRERFLPLLEINEDTVGWITVPNTSIDYPIVQTKDNDYYLDHNFQHSKSDAGSIFMDFRNAPDLSDRHSIIYGHHMRDGSMFKGLINYQDEDFFEHNRTITIQTLTEETEWEIFSAYVTATDFYYIVTDFSSDQEYLDFLELVQNKSQYQPNDVPFTHQDQLLTLSTCAYDFEDARFVVHARKIK
ncbi:class B sortase [Alkalihalobacterium chitinilyticum]|uniref:Class B sortase n=1 Tax=Alkalihalobacterium chitinilyticum TaxID=2980103 RepID=A0ABT5VAP3_9BACI|nr:class B sortase [Alkalihalobacterium chitinilyticum]MDE5412541.1 class B sortase [Alkalihalobacterium chitinilyticum]